MASGLAERVWAKVRQEGGCWVWGGRVNWRGYGYMSFRDQDRPVHRLMYEACRQPVPENLTLDHLCRNLRCVNPDHLEPVTNRENILRGDGPAAICARKTHCKRGHALTPDNLYSSPSVEGQRVCKTCTRAKLRARRLGKRLASNSMALV